MSRAARLEPFLLLVAAGGAVGLIFPLARVAGDLGIPPATYAGLSALGAAGVLAALARAAGARLVPRAAELRYAAVAGQLTFAIPFGTLAAVVPAIGAGIPAILQSLAPLLTLGLVWALGQERPGLLRGLGLALGFAGVLLILRARGAGAGAGAVPPLWLAAAFVTPLALAAGNVYRSAAWPPGAGALPLAAFTLAAAAPGLLALAVLPAGSAALRLSAAGWALIGAQSLATGIGYAFFFRLQRVGGAVYLSQISYVNTAVGVLFAVAAFGERLPPAAWAAGIAIFAGIALVSLAPKPDS